MLPTAADLWTQRARDGQLGPLQFAPVRVIAALVLLVPGAFFDLVATDHNRMDTWRERAIPAAISVLLLCGAVASYTYIFEGRPPRELALRRAGREWLAGTLAGAALFALALGALVALGAYRVTTGGTTIALAQAIGMYGAQSLVEEMVFRVVIFKVAEESLGTWAALAIQAVLFGALHLGNPHVTAFAVLALAIEAGLLLAAAYMLTRRVWLAWGIHFGWNAIQGNVFGVRVSGLSVLHSLLRSTPIGAAWLTGGDFGVEASPVALLVGLLGTAALLHFAARRGQFVSFHAARERIAAPAR